MLVGVDTAHFCHLDKLVFFGLNQMYQIDDKSNANLNLEMSFMEKMYEFKRIGMNDIEVIKELFISVFTIEPWNDDWSNQEQLDLYLSDLIGQSNSLTYGLFENKKMIAVSMGHIRHWFSGTEYYIDELCVRTDKQGKGIGTYFLKEIERGIKDIGLVQIFLQTENNVPAYGFYQKNGYYELKEHVSFVKKV